MDYDWDAIQQAFKMVDARLVQRIENTIWTVYRVENIVRIDLKG